MQCLWKKRYAKLRYTLHSCHNILLLKRTNILYCYSSRNIVKITLILRNLGIYVYQLIKKREWSRVFNHDNDEHKSQLIRHCK